MNRVTPQPAVKNGPVLVRVAATRVNTIDTMIRRLGQENLPLSPATAGRAGEIEALARIGISAELTVSNAGKNGVWTMQTVPYTCSFGNSHGQKSTCPLCCCCIHEEKSRKRYF